MEKKKINQLTVGSIRYVYDEQAAWKWFDAYVEIVKKNLITNTSK